MFSRKIYGSWRAHSTFYLATVTFYTRKKITFDKLQTRLKQSLDLSFFSSNFQVYFPFLLKAEMLILMRHMDRHGVGREMGKLLSQNVINLTFCVLENEERRIV